MIDARMPDDLEAQLLAIIDAHVPDSFAHGRLHVLRVVALCKRIADDASRHHGARVDMQVLLAAAYLHDLGRLDELKPLSNLVPPKDDPHASRSAAFARDILRAASGFPRGKIPAVERAILSHSFTRGEAPDSIEGEILSDADKIDAIGAQGIIRTVAYSVEQHRSLQDTLDHFNEKILKLKGLLYTRAAREIAVAKHEIVSSFVDDLVHGMAGVPARARKTSSK